MKLNKKKASIIVVLLAIVLLSTTSLVLVVSGVFDKITNSTTVSRDRTSVILLQDENDEKLVHVYLGMADDDSVASFQLGLGIDVNASTDVEFNWSNDSLKENYLKKAELSGEDSENKELHLYYVGTQELNTNEVDEIEIGTINLSVPNDEQTNLVITPDQDFTTISTIGHNRIKTVTEPTDVLSNVINEKNIPLDEITLNVTEKEINVNDVFELELTYSPDDTTDDKTIKWSSSDDSIALVNANGAVTGLREGIAYIYAEVGDKKATCKVIVNEPKIELQKIELNKTEVTLVEGQKASLSVKYLPDGVIYKGTLEWESSNTSVATVDNGEIVAVGTGETTITVTAEENGNTFNATCKVTVNKLPEGNIAIDESDFDLSIGHTKQLSVIGNDVDTSNVTWESSDPSIVSVDENGVVTALKEGTATITARVGDKVATVQIVSVYKEIKLIEIQAEKTKLKVEETSNTQVIVYPEDASLPIEYTLTSSNPEILSVNDSHQITGVSEGKAILTAKTDNGVTDQVEITVVDKGLALATGDSTLGIAVSIIIFVLSINVIGVIVGKIKLD